MNKYVKEFIHRGLIFAGLGPIILGIIYSIISTQTPAVSLSAKEVCMGIISIYLLAFFQAGASVFNIIEHWSVMKSTFYHFLTIYIAYLLCYLLNSWIPFNFKIILIFTTVFILTYLIIWIIVYFSVKNHAEKLNKKLNKF